MVLLSDFARWQMECFLFPQTIQFKCRLLVASARQTAVRPWSVVLPAGFAFCGWTEAQHQPSAPCAQESLLPLSDTWVGHSQPVIHPTAQQRKWGVCGNLTSRRLPRQEECPGWLWRERISNPLPSHFVLLVLLRATEQGRVSQLQPTVLAFCVHGCSLGLPNKHFPDSASVG